MRLRTRRYVLTTVFAILSTAAASSASAAITTAGSVTGGGTPYNGTDNPWNVNNLIVGNIAPGSMSITGGYTVNDSGSGIIANSAAGSTSSVTVDGLGSKWISQAVAVGYMGTATLDVTNGATVLASQYGLYVGYYGSGTVTVSGPGSKIMGDTSAPLPGFFVGYLGTGTVKITDGGSVSSGGPTEDTETIIGAGSGTHGTIVVGGGVGSSTWKDSGDAIFIGEVGTGTLTVTGGGTVQTNATFLGGYEGSSGVATVGGGTGAAVWTSSAIFIGGGFSNGSGRLDVLGGGSVSTGVCNMGGYGSASEMNVGGGSGNASFTTGDLNMNGGTISVTNGGTVTSSEAFIGETANDVETAVVNVGDGTGTSVFKSLGPLYVGFAGDPSAGVLNINSAGFVSAQTLDGGNATSSVNFNGGTLSITNADSASNTINLLTAGETIDVPTSGTTFTVTSAISGVGGLTKTGTATLALTGANTYMGGTTVSGGTLSINNTAGSATGTGIIVVNNSGTLAGAGSASGAVTVNAGGKIAPGNSIGTLSVGGLTLASSTSTLQIEVNASTTPAADLLNVTGGVSLNGGTLSLSFLNGPTSFDVPKTILIVANDLSDAVSGTFGSVTGVPSGFVVTVNYAYAGTDALGRIGTGNDVAVTVFSAVPEASAVAMWGVIACSIGCASAYRKLVKGTR